MGGKTKQTPRSKNKPSSSFRSAELLGSVPTFVGFTATAGFGMVPVAPGLMATEKLAETFDGKISHEYQLVLRKLTKKDPITKKKGLLELIDLIEKTDMDELKVILPLWPQYYQSLANSVEHNLRELAQSVLQLFVTKCKRAVAPYLRQLVPVWLASQFDNFAPASSIATRLFADTFPPETRKLHEVCMHCQAEIMDYTIRNITFHSVSTLASDSELSKAEAEQKYQRVLLCSLKALSFFVQHTAQAQDRSQIRDNFEKLFGFPKFWSVAKEKLANIKAAWFELMTNVLQQADLVELLHPYTAQLIGICFRNIDESDPLVAPHVWAAILQVQTIFSDWYTHVNVKASLMPKLSSLLRQGIQRNAEAVCPDLLPFFCMLLQSESPDIERLPFCGKFFDDLLTALQLDSAGPSRVTGNAIVKSYFECLRFLAQKINQQEVAWAGADELRQLAQRLLDENILAPIALLVGGSPNHNSKSFFSHAASLVAFWTERQAPDGLYAGLVEHFWRQIAEIVSQTVDSSNVYDGKRVEEQGEPKKKDEQGETTSKKDEEGDTAKKDEQGETTTKKDEQGETTRKKKDSPPLFENTYQLLKHLHLASSSLAEQKVKFSHETSASSSDLETSGEAGSPQKPELKPQLRRIIGQLVNRLVAQPTGSRSIGHLHRLLEAFADRDMYARLVDEQQPDIKASLDVIFQGFELLEKADKDAATGDAYNSLADIACNILKYTDNDDKLLDYLQAKLFAIPVLRVHTVILGYLLSADAELQPKVRQLMAHPKVSELLVGIAKAVAEDFSKDKLRVLQRCFRESNGRLLIASPVADAIVRVLAAAFTDPQKDGRIKDPCAVFLTQLLPTLCRNNNASVAVRNEVFLRMLSASLSKPSRLSKDTQLKVDACWPRALQAGHIQLDANLMNACRSIVDDKLLLAVKQADAQAQIDSIAEALTRLVVTASRAADPKSGGELADKTLEILLQQPHKDLSRMADLCLYIQAVNGDVTPCSALRETSAASPDTRRLFGKIYLNLSVVYKLLCDCAPQEDDDDQSLTVELHQLYAGKLADLTLSCLYAASVGDYINSGPFAARRAERSGLAQALSDRAKALLSNGGAMMEECYQRILKLAAAEVDSTWCRAVKLFAHYERYALLGENATIVLYEEVSDELLAGDQSKFKAYANLLQNLLPQLAMKTLTLNSPVMRVEPLPLWTKVSVFRSLIRNNFSRAEGVNEIADRNIVSFTLSVITQLMENDEIRVALLVRDAKLTELEHERMMNTTEVINLCYEVVHRFPNQLSMKNWDSIRIALNSWVLAVSKSINDYGEAKVAIFIAAVYRLVKAMLDFIRLEERRSSTEVLTKMIEEWKSIFAREVNVLLFNAFCTVCEEKDKCADNVDYKLALVVAILPTIESLDYSYIYNFYKSSSSQNLDYLCTFLLRNLSNSSHLLRITCSTALKRLSVHFIADDVEVFTKGAEQVQLATASTNQTHFLQRYEDYIGRYSMPILDYLKEFSFRHIEIPNFRPIDKDVAFSYMLLWDCMIHVCSTAPLGHRSTYTKWLHENKYEDNFLHFLFRAMPKEILKNYDIKTMSGDIFKGLTPQEIMDDDLSVELYSCHLYTEALRKLPAIVRKWWTACPSREKTFVDRLTTNFVSPIICSEELSAIVNKQNKPENMRVSVQFSTREINAAYTIDEARLEMIITLALNYPLGTVKVDCGKQLGGKLLSRSDVMNLTLFLSHQNGSIYDGLSLWKENLDKKFEGINQCTICFTVLHQETCQLPRITCKTCKHKFHGACLHTWFSTSSKSTCPTCRNVF